MDATRTQIDAAAIRFHYHRGYDDAIRQSKRESNIDSAMNAVFLAVAVLVGWFAHKNFGVKKVR